MISSAELPLEHEIHGFGSPGQYRSFVRHIEILLSTGDLQEVAVDPDYGRGEIYGGRWFRLTDTGEVWRLVPPDFPFRGVWEPVQR